MNIASELERSSVAYAKMYPAEYQDRRLAYVAGGLKGMEIQKELDLHEIERLKECLSGFVRISHLLEYPEPIDPGHLGEAYAIHNAIESARKLIKP